MKPNQTTYALNGVAQGYLTRNGYQGRCAIHTSQLPLWFIVTSSLGFEISSAWKSSTEYASAMNPIFHQNRFVPQFKHTKGMEIVMGYIESLSSYTHYWKSCLVPNLLIGKINRPAQLAQGWTCHQAVFCHSDLGGSTGGNHSLLLLTPPEMLLHPCPYEDIPNQPWNPMLDSVKLVTSAVPKIQPTQPYNPEAQVYGSMDEV